MAEIAALEGLFSLDDVTKFTDIVEALESIVTMKPSNPEMTSKYGKLMSLGLSQLAKFKLIHQKSPSSYPKMVGETFEFLFGPKPRKEILTALTILIRDCITLEMAQDISISSTVSVMIKLVTDALSNILYQDSMGPLLMLAASLFHRLGPAKPIALKELLTALFELRDDPNYYKGFTAQHEMDICICNAIQFMGISTFTAVIPFNIEETLQSKAARRPYLLSLMSKALVMNFPKCQWHLPETRVFGRHELKWFLEFGNPLSQRLFTKSMEYASKQQMIEAKLYQTMGMQIWDILPLICANLPADIGLFPSLAPLLGKVLSTLPSDLYPNLASDMDLRRLVCEALCSLVEGYSALSSLEVDPSDPDRLWKSAHVQNAQKGVEVLKLFATQFLAVLCNSYTTIDTRFMEQHKASRGQTLQVVHEREIQFYERTIQAFLGLADPKPISDYFTGLLKTLSTPSNANVSPNHMVRDMERLRSYSVLELCLTLLPYLQSDESLFSMLYNILVKNLESNDVTLLKKAYRGLNELLDRIGVESIKSNGFLDIILDAKVVQNVAGGSRRQRLVLLEKMCKTIGQDADSVMRVFPLILTESMLATKESNEKTRESAYACLIAMAQVMQSYGNGDEEMSDESEDAPRKPSLKEFVVMMVAGFAGSTTHMQSAAIASIARVLFDFSTFLEPSLIQEIIKTVLMVMESETREIVKACLGFIKVCVISLDATILQSQLEPVILAILKHSRNHRSHFRVKVRHLFERLIRRFGFDTIEVLVPESDKNLTRNIRKRRERQKKKGKTESKGPQSFSKALNDSDSELGSDESDDEGFLPQSTFSKKTKESQEPQLYEEDGEVIDFLGKNVTSHLVQKPKQKAQKVQKKDSFKTQEGRLVIAESEDEKESKDEEKDTFDYYKASMNNELAFTRTPGGQVKFLNEKKRAREEDDEDGPTKQVGIRWGAKSQKSKKDSDASASQMLGRQYKAKNAKGDVKRPGMADPFAFIPLKGQVVGNMHKSTKLDGTLKNILKAAQKGSEVGTKAAKHRGTSKGNKKHK